MVSNLVIDHRLVNAGILYANGKYDSIDLC